MRAVLATLVLVGCGFDSSLPPNAVFSCGPANECPSTRTCDEATRRCVLPVGGVLSAATVTPEVAGLGKHVVVELTTLVAQRAAPTLKVLRRSAAPLTPFSSLGDDGSTWRFEWTVEADAPNERVAIVGDFVDGQGRPASDVFIGELTIDTVPPALSGATTFQLAPPAGLLSSVEALGIGSTARLTISASEPLASAPSLECAQATLTREGAGTAPYTFSLSGTAQLSEGRCRVHAKAVDLAGNLADVELEASLTVDVTPPAPPSGTRLVDTGSSAKVDGLAEPRAAVFALTSTEPTPSAVLGRTQAGSDGGFELSLGGVPASAFVVAVDGAGNVGPVSPLALRAISFGSTAAQPRVELLASTTAGRALRLPTDTTLTPKRDLEVLGGASWALRSHHRSPRYVGLACSTVFSRGTIEGSAATASELSRWATDVWTRAPLSDELSVPDGRSHFRAAHGRWNAETVMFGGLSSTPQPQPLGDTWVWSGSRWRLVPSATSPPPRLLQAMASDERERHTVLAGGFACLSGCAALRDTWVYDGVGWSKLDAGLPPMPNGDSNLGPAGATSAEGQPLVYAPMVDGGAVVLTLRNGTWSSPVPAPRVFHASLTVEEDTGALVLAGGDSSAAPRTLQVFRAEDGGWRQLPLPARMTYFGPASACFDPAARAVQIVTDNNGGASEQTWLLLDGGLVLQTEFLASMSVPEPRSRASLAFVPSEGKVLLAGGERLDGTPLADAWWWTGSGFVPHASLPAVGQQSALNLVAGSNGQPVVHRCLANGTGGATTQQTHQRTDAGTWQLVRQGDPCRAWERATASASGLFVVGGSSQLADARPASLSDESSTFAADGTRTLVGRLPAGRVGFALVTHPLTNQPMLVGGLAEVDATTSLTTSDVLTWSGTGWVMEQPLGAIISDREGAAAATDLSRHETVLVGGQRAASDALGVWRLKSKVVGTVKLVATPSLEWVQVIPGDPELDGELPWFADGAMAYDAARRRLVHVGGAVALGAQRSDHMPATADAYEFVSAERAPAITLLLQAPPSYAADGGPVSLSVSGTLGASSSLGAGLSQRGLVEVWLRGHWVRAATSAADGSFSFTLRWPRAPALFTDLGVLGLRVRPEGSNGDGQARLSLTHLEGELEWEP